MSEVNYEVICKVKCIENKQGNANFTQGEIYEMREYRDNARTITCNFIQLFMNKNEKPSNGILDFAFCKFQCIGKNYNFIEETKNIDDCECVYCGHKFDGQEAINNDLDERVISCPNCHKEMNVFMSVEYTCQELK